ncbi:MAG: hypothetical protein ACKV2T_18175 [Kofleriaceae bacterium]
MSNNGWDVAGSVAKRALEELSGGLIKEQKGWDPVVPPDLHVSRLPPVAADGTCVCIQCSQRRPYAEMTIASEMYFCPPCFALRTRVQAQEAAAGVDVENIKIGRGVGAFFLRLGLALGAIALGIVVFVVFYL